MTVIQTNVPLFDMVLYEIIPDVDVFVLIELDARPFFSIRIALMLSWYSVALLTSNPWFRRKDFFNSTCGYALCTATSSQFFELVVFNFFLWYARDASFPD